MEDSDSDTEFYIERVLAKREYEGVTQYLIKWKDYPLKDSTWERGEDIIERYLIEAFESDSKSKSSLAASSSSQASSSIGTTSANQTSGRPSKKRGTGRENKTKTVTFSEC